jgi:hypothetical protein
MRVTVLLLALASAFVLAADNAETAPRAVTGLKPQTTTYGAEAITIPQMLSYQGKLTDNLGNAVRDSNYSVTFRLFTQPSGGSAFWNETQSVQTRAGLFSCLLGSATPIPQVPDAGNLYLEMQVNPNPAMTPRVRIVSAAYAYNAYTANYALASAGGGGDNAWVRGTPPDSVLYTAHYLGIARGEGRNLVCGSLAYTHVNLGARCTTGTAGFDNSFCTVGGGELNIASWTQATIAGGVANRACSVAATVSGGSSNIASGRFSTVGGGYNNVASRPEATVGGGNGNSATGHASTVGGGYGNAASDTQTTVGGGGENQASKGGATIGGGWRNLASGYNATVSGGGSNAGTGDGAAVGGGWEDTASGRGATVAGGGSNAATGDFSVVAGGWGGRATDANATVGGGWYNVSSDTQATIAGGGHNVASYNCATVGGGWGNTSSNRSATVAGGQENSATGINAAVGGGYWNKASGYCAAVPGGRADSCIADYGLAAGNGVRVASSAFNTFAFGSSFTTSTPYAVVFYNSGQTTKLGVGVANPTHYIDCPNNNYCDASGWHDGSSRTLKKDITELTPEQYEQVLAELGKTNVVHYRYKTEESGKVHIGLIAEDAPERVASLKRDAISTNDAIGFLMAAVKAQQAEIEQLKVELAQQDNGRNK